MILGDVSAFVPSACGLLWRGVVPFFPLPSADSVVMAILVLILYMCCLHYISFKVPVCFGCVAHGIPVWDWIFPYQGASALGSLSL